MAIRTKFITRAYLVDQYKAFLAKLQQKELGYDALKTDADTLHEAVNEVYDIASKALVFGEEATFADWQANRQHQHITDGTKVVPAYGVIVGEDFELNDKKYYAGSLIYGVSLVADADNPGEFTYDWNVLENMDGHLGDVTELTTTEKDTVVGAINELDEKQGDDDLETEAQDLSGAVNELKAEVEKRLIFNKVATYADWQANFEHAHITDGTKPVKPIGVVVDEDFENGGKKYYKGSVLYGTTIVADAIIAGEFTYDWNVLENVDGHLGDVEILKALNIAEHDNVIESVQELDTEIGNQDDMLDRVKDEDADGNPITTPLVNAINNNAEDIELLEEDVEKIKIDDTTHFHLNGKPTVSTFFQGDLYAQEPECYTDKNDDAHLLVRMYQITNGGEYTKLDGKYHQAGSIIYATETKYDPTLARDIYDWQVLDNVDGKIGNLANLTTYTINEDGTTVEKKDSLVDAINANKTLIGKLEEIDTTNISVGGIQEGFIQCVALGLQDIINRIGMMTDLNEYQKDTLMSALITALRWVGTKQDQTDGISLTIDPSVDTLIKAVNALGNWLGDPHVFNGVWGDGTKSLTSVVYEVLTAEALNHLQVKGTSSYSNWETNIKDSTDLQKGDAYIINDEFDWTEGEDTIHVKRGSWFYLYSTAGFNQWQLLKNGGGNPYIYQEVTALPTSAPKTDVIYVVPNDKGKKECWVYLNAESEWLLISSDSEAGSSWIGTFKTGKNETTFAWKDLPETSKKAIFNAYVVAQGKELRDGLQISCIYSDSADATPAANTYNFKGIYQYKDDTAEWVAIFELAEGSEQEKGIVKLATDGEYGNKDAGVAVQPKQIKEDLEANYYKNVEVDEELAKKADDALVYKKTETYTQTEVDGLLKTLSRSKFVDFNPETASPAVIAQYYGYQLFYGNDTDGYNVYLVDTDGAVKNVGTLKVSEDLWVLQTDPKYLTLADIKTKDEDDNPLTVQMQLDGKQDVIPAASAIQNWVDKAMTPKMAVVTNANGKLIPHSKVTADEVGYLEGVKENIQTQIDNISSGATQSGWNIGDVKMSMQRSQRNGDWLLCDGTAYLREDYQDLFDIIGRCFSEPSLDATLFRVPNMQGRVPRGVDSFTTVQSLDYAHRYVGDDLSVIERTDLPNETINTDTDEVDYDGRHGHADIDFDWFTAGNHTHVIQYYGTKKSGKDTRTCVSYSENGDGNQSPKVNSAAGNHIHFKQEGEGTSINASTTSAHQHKIQLNGGVTQTAMNNMQATVNLCNYYIKWK